MRRRKGRKKKRKKRVNERKEWEKTEGGICEETDALKGEKNK